MNFEHHPVARVAGILASAALCGMAAVAPMPALASSPPPTSWEVAGEFDDLASVGPVWSYGVNTGPAFVPFQQPPVSGGCLTGFMSSFPAVMHNAAMTTCTSGITVAPRALVLHPGPNGEAAVVRFKAPAAAYYRVSGQFYGVDLDGLGTHTSVSLVATNVVSFSWTVFSGSIALPTVGQASFTSKYVMLRAGEALDFAVRTTPRRFSNATTGLHAVIERAGDWCGITDPNNPDSTSTC